MALRSGRQEFKTPQLKIRSAGEELSLGSAIILSNKSIEIGRSTLESKPGTVKLSGHIDRTNSALPFLLKISAREIPFKKVVALSSQKSQPDSPGMIRSFNADLKGTVTNPINSLSGKGKATANVPLREDSSLIDAVTKAVSAIIPSSVFGDDEDSEKRPTSAAEFEIREGAVFVTKLTVRQPHFTLTGAGKAEFGGKLEGTAEAIFLKQSLGKLSFGISALDHVLASTGRVVVPLKVSGTTAEPKVEVDLIRLPSTLPGVSLVGDSVGGVVDIGKKGLGVILSPFRSRSSGKKGDREGSPAQ
jgi:hypothetical protein